MQSVLLAVRFAGEGSDDKRSSFVAQAGLGFRNSALVLLDVWCAVGICHHALLFILALFSVPVGAHTGTPWHFCLLPSLESQGRMNVKLL